MQWLQASIFRRVVLPMLLVFIMAVVVSFSVVRKVSLHELEEVLTSNLSTSAKSLFGVLRNEFRNDDASVLQGIVDRYSEHQNPLPNELSAELYEAEQANLRYIYLQLYVPTLDARVSSRELPLFTFDTRKSGFFEVAEGEHRWQMYGVNDDATGAWFYMGQRDDYLAEIHDESNEAMAWALLLLLPLLAAMIWYGVLRGLQPLRELSHEIDRRESENMQLLSLQPATKETRPLIHALNELLQRLTDTLANERQFTADAAHELRTPIASLRAQLGVLQGARSEDEREQAVRDIDRATVRMSELVANLLALARLDSNAELPAAESYDLRARLEGVIAEHAFVAMEKQVEISLHGLEHCPLTGTAYLHELLAANLIINAIKYTPPGGQVTVYLEHVAGAVEYRVEDTGPGVPESELATLTERFRRVRQTGGESAQGAGLGLSIAARCAQLAHAELTLYNRQPTGFCAKVKL